MAAIPAATPATPATSTARPRSRAAGAGRTGRRMASATFWYIVLGLIALVFVFPFVWIFLTSIKGPDDLLFSTPPQLLPHDPTLANYGRVLDVLPIPKFFLNSIVVSTALTTFNVLIAALAAYPLAKMRFRGRDLIF